MIIYPMFVNREQSADRISTPILGLRLLSLGPTLSLKLSLLSKPAVIRNWSVSNHTGKKPTTVNLVALAITHTSNMTLSFNVSTQFGLLVSKLTCANVASTGAKPVSTPALALVSLSQTILGPRLAIATLHPPLQLPQLSQLTPQPQLLQLTPQLIPLLKPQLPHTGLMVLNSLKKSMMHTWQARVPPQSTPPLLQHTWLMVLK